MPQLVDRLAAIREGAGFDGCFKQPALRELHNIETEIRRRTARLQMERIQAVTDDISIDQNPYRRVSEYHAEERYNRLMDRC